MKNGQINKIISAKETSGFSFGSDLGEVTWFIVLNDGKMLARREFLDPDNMPHDDYVVAPYENMDACERIYRNVIIDMVEVYADDLLTGDNEGNELFTGVADQYDETLEYVLGLFGKSYAEFLLDFMKYYGAYVEAQMFDLIGDVCDDESDDGYDSEEYHLVRKVLERIGKAIEISYDLGDELASGTVWEFAKSHGIVFYHRLDYDYDGEYVDYIDEWCAIPEDDVDAMSALHDAVLSTLIDEKIEYTFEVDEGALELVGLSIEEIAG